jgi:hypothetical protein
MDIGFGKKENRMDDRQDMDIGDIRGSLRKMEQTIESLSTRLDAVERRLSDMDFEPKFDTLHSSFCWENEFDSCSTAAAVEPVRSPKWVILGYNPTLTVG